MFFLKIYVKFYVLKQMFNPTPKKFQQTSLYHSIYYATRELDIPVYAQLIASLLFIDFIGIVIYLLKTG